MSFADELRNAPEQARQEEKRQREEDFKKLADIWYERLKNICLSVARKGGNYYDERLSDFAKRIEETDNYSNKAWWERISPHIRCVLNPRYSDRIDFCLDREDLEKVISMLEARFKKDGLDVKFEKIEKQKYRYKSVWVEKQTSEKVIGGILSLLSSPYGDDSDGRYVQRKIEDGFRYDLDIKLRW